MTVQLPDGAPLSGGDYMALVLDHALRRAGGTGNFCQLLLRLSPAPDPGWLASLLGCSAGLQWLAKATVRRPVPFLLPRWRLGASPSPFPAASVAAPDALPPDGSIPVPPAAPGFACQMLGKDVLHLRWHHAVLDARGVEVMLQHAGGDSEAGVLFPPAAVPADKGFLQQSLEARKAAFEVEDLGRGPVAAPAAGVDDGGPPMYHRTVFDPDETATLDTRADATGARFRRSLFLLAGVVAALERLRRTRGQEPAPYVIPLPTDVRRRGAPGPAFGNPLTFQFFRLEPSGDVASLVSALVGQQDRQIRDGLPTGFRGLMEWQRHFPAALLARLLVRASGGHPASVFFSDLGESFQAGPTVAGFRVVDMLHLPPIAPRPGIAVVCHRFAGRQNVTIAASGSAMRPADVESLATDLRHILLGTRSS